MDVPALGEENLAKNLVENDKKIDDWACLSWKEIERKFWKLLKKLSWISQDPIKKKKKKKLIHNFRLIENQFRLIEINRGSLKIFNVISIDGKIDWINWNFGKIIVLKTQQILWINSLKHWILWIKCMSMRWNVFPKHKF